MRKEMNMKTLKLSFVLFLLLPQAIFQADVVNPDRPLKGEWDFKLNKVWEIGRAGEDVFGFPFSLTAAENGTLYVYDSANRINYIFDKDGNFLRAFARRGQGPGEVMGQDLIHYIDGKVYIPTLNGIHIFTADGIHVQTVKQESSPLIPRIFLSGDEIITAPKTAVFLPDGKGRIIRKNIRTGNETVIAEFSIQDWGIAQSGENVVDMIAIGFSPLMILGYAENRIYWGMNTSYTIHVTDLSGKTTSSFSLKRKSRNVTDKFKREYFKSPGLPEEMLDQIAGSFPNRISFFHRIEIHNGLVYVFVPDVDLKSKRAKLKQIDIFSPEGKYLFRAEIKFPGDRHPLFSPLNNLIIQGNHLYAVLMDEKDSALVAKYEVTVPHGN
jgi:hypothetical protein